jgi:hypothetical protein
LPGRFRQVLNESGWIGLGRRLAGRQLLRLAAETEKLARSITSPRDLGQYASPAMRRLLERNAELRGRHAGRRAFVLASGPSTLSLDLSRLNGEVVIAVNEMFERLLRERVMHPYLLMVDPVYFSGGAYDRCLADLSTASSALDARVMLPAAAAGKLDRGLFGHDRVNYAIQVGRFMDYPAFTAVPPLDFTKPLPGMYTVSHLAVALALFMGCTEVYLLGVDMDYIADPEQPIRHGYGDNPYNDHDRISAMEAYKRDAGWDYPALLRQAADQQAAFARLHEIAAANGQALFNATPGGCLSVLPRKAWAELF